jgi:hypothetical protein
MRLCECIFHRKLRGVAGRMADIGVSRRARPRQRLRHLDPIKRAWQRAVDEHGRSDFHRRHYAIVLMEQFFAIQHHLMGPDAIETIFACRQRSLAGLLEFARFRHQAPAHLDDGDVAGSQMLLGTVDDRAG